MYDQHIIRYLVAHANREQKLAGVKGDVAQSIYWLSRSMHLSGMLKE